MPRWQSISAKILRSSAGNINYPITCAYTMALAARLLGGAHFAAKAKQLADFAVAHITPDGLLYGEGHCMTTVTPKNCRPVDLGYNVEESLPALILYAELTEDETVRRAVLHTARGTPQLYAARRRVGQQLRQPAAISGVGGAAAPRTDALRALQP